MSRIVGHVTPPYCLSPGMTIVIQRGEQEVLLTVEKVDRRWKKESGRAQPCADGSLRYFQPETVNTNGQNPCLVYFKGEPRPWYFESGWDNVVVFAQQFHGDDD